ncbi:MAG: hypothetical protein JNL57_09845 [Bacteroidetes bacterium]|nr:hypothetical protein [Bacteroidota bacterium]
MTVLFMLRKKIINRSRKKSKPELPADGAESPWYTIFYEWPFWEFVLCILFIISIFVFGPKLSKWYADTYENKVWKNGKIITGKLERHGYLKGNYILIEYEFNKRKYTFKEFTSSYGAVPEGTNLMVMVDSTDPEDAVFMGIEVRE